MEKKAKGKTGNWIGVGVVALAMILNAPASVAGQERSSGETSGTGELVEDGTLGEFLHGSSDDCPRLFCTLCALQAELDCEDKGGVDWAYCGPNAFGVPCTCQYECNAN